MDDSCCDLSCSCMPQGSSRIILACSGASNLGQIANKTATLLQHRGIAKMSCLAAVGADLESYIKSARKADKLIVLDGCPVACGKKICEKAGIAEYNYISISSLIPKLKKEARYDQIDDCVNEIWNTIIAEL